MSASRFVHIDVAKILQETAKAFLVLTEEGEELWLPKSQVSDPGDYEAGDKDCVISVSEWIAKQKGLV